MRFFSLNVDSKLKIHQYNNTLSFHYQDRSNEFPLKLKNKTIAQTKSKGCLYKCVRSRAYMCSNAHVCVCVPVSCSHWPNFCSFKESSVTCFGSVTIICCYIIKLKQSTIYHTTQVQYLFNCSLLRINYLACNRLQRRTSATVNEFLVRVYGVVCGGCRWVVCLLAPSCSSNVCCVFVDAFTYKTTCTIYY